MSVVFLKIFAHIGLIRNLDSFSFIYVYVVAQNFYLLASRHIINRFPGFYTIFTVEILM